MRSSSRRSAFLTTLLLKRMESRGLRAFFALICLLAASSVTGRGGAVEDRQKAVDRALDFVQAVASSDANLSRFGSDLLWCFYSISHTSRDRRLGAKAARMGREAAERWRRLHPHVPADVSAGGVYDLLAGAYAAERFGFPDDQFKDELRLAAARFKAKDFLGFDAAREPPPLDDPRRYDIFTDALIRSFFGEAYGIPLGARYREVLRWLPSLRPYEGHDEGMEFDAFYTVTHAIYTLNRYHESRIEPSLIPDEIAFVRRKLDAAMEDEDPEMVAEALDCLKAAGFARDPQVRRGMKYLVTTQRADGAWAGDPDDLYTQYHSAWAAIDGLRDYRFHGEISKLPLN
ncbi:MAG TPA: hypothetical protein VKW06_10155 [Candidatus Angelobacter sp.]|nr:hypothetical protein [Candidatus Angelobacter sp.]